MASPRPFLVADKTPRERMFATALSVAQHEGYSLQGVCNEGFEAMFISPDTEKDAGRIIMVSAVHDGDEPELGSALQVTVAEQTGTSWSWSNGKKIQAVGERFIGSVTSALQSGVEPDPERTESFARREDGTVVPWAPGDEPWE